MDADAPPPRLVVTRSREARRYELHLDGALVSFADYRRTDGDDGDVVTIPHVETLPELRGNGYADLLMSGIVDHLRSRHRRIDPVCPFARQYIVDRPELHDLLVR